MQICLAETGKLNSFLRKIKYSFPLGRNLEERACRPVFGVDLLNKYKWISLELNDYGD
jgi:hypothetical protein